MPTTFLGPNCQIGSGSVVFVKMSYMYVPFAAPTSCDIANVFTSNQSGGGCIVTYQGAQFDALNEPTLKLAVITPQNASDTVPVSVVQMVATNVFQMISSQTKRLFGVSVSKVYQTCNDDFCCQQVGSDIGNTAQSTVKKVGEIAKKTIEEIGTTAGNTAGNVLKPISTTIIILLVVVVIGIFAIGYAGKETGV